MAKQSNTIEDKLNQARKELLVLANKSITVSKKTDSACADEISQLFNQCLGKLFFEHEYDDLSACSAIGTMHWYRSKSRTLFKFLEIRKYDKEAQQDTRVLLVIGTDREEIKNISDRVVSFYKGKGYEMLGLGNPGSKHSWDKDTKF